MLTHPSSPHVTKCSSLISLTASIEVAGPLKISCDSSTIFQTRTVPSRPPALTARSRTPASMPVIRSWWPNLKIHISLLLNSWVGLDRSTSPGSLCLHWLGHLSSLPSPPRFARSHSFYDFYMEG